MKRRRCYTRTTATTATFATFATIPLSQSLIQFQYAIIVGHGRLCYKGGTLKLPGRMGSACRIFQEAGRRHCKGVPLWSPSRGRQRSASRFCTTLEFTLIIYGGYRDRTGEFA